MGLAPVTGPGVIGTAPPSGSPAPANTVSLSADENSYMLFVVQGTGLDPGVVATWIACESGQNTTKGDHNYLNIGPGRTYPDAQSAAADVIATLHNGLYQGILASAGQAQAAQIAAIKASPWDAGHYSSGCLEATLGVVAQAGPNSGGVQTTSFLSGLGNFLDALDPGLPLLGGASGAASAASTLLKFIAELFTWNLWRRILSVGGGAVLLMIGFGIIYRDAFKDVAKTTGRVAELAGMAAA